MVYPPLTPLSNTTYGAANAGNHPPVGVGTSELPPKFGVRQVFARDDFESDGRYNGQPMITVDADFPGGNILVEATDGDSVSVHQDLRTTTEWWFYWHFRVRSAAGRTVRFNFTNKNVFTAAGPCFSEDGYTWRWLGPEVVVDNGFSHTFDQKTDTAYFSLGVPYTEAHLWRFYTDHPRMERGTLCQSEGGRNVEYFRLRSKRHDHTVFLSSRTHACEAMATYALEGILAFWLNDPSAEGQWLRDHVDLLAVPFVDKDGVETGDQGKLRAPHDHNRDYIDRPLYASTKAIIAAIAGEGDKLRLGIDLHCPWIRGNRNEDFYVVGPPPPWEHAAMRLAHVIDEATQGDVPLSAKHYLPFGVDWNNNAQARTLSRHICTQPSAKVGVSVEVPYGLSSGVIMTADRGRGVGLDLGRAVARFLQE